MGRQTFTFGDRTIEWQGATIGDVTQEGASAVLKTNRGRIAARLHSADSTGPRKGVIWLSGAGGGIDGPARRVYVEASDRLQRQGITSLRLDYRKPQDLEGCVVDVLCGAAFLGSSGKFVPGWEKVAICKFACGRRAVDF
jgi:hypothetical protein